MILKTRPRVAIHVPNTENSQEEHIGIFVHRICCFL